ncbi:cytosolic phospholipase A2 epsilon-like [Platysternon megacephalum]|uniref:Cytosolic phospholipase A2 epsilon-like n=1 Tax=Platysternon megacephalum TaxID=55544 RepID=A0A4D9EXJ9_9SAUR|nr:cytosolic phospholipase A2 epsilon-like [Platysternon megacephalum]
MINSPRDTLRINAGFTVASGSSDVVVFGPQTNRTRKQHASHYQNTRNNPDCSLTFCVFHSKKHLGSVTPSHEETKGHKPGLLNFHEKNYSRSQQVLARDISSW